MRFVCAITIALLLAATAYAAQMPALYGGNGGHPNPDGSPLSINNGWLILIGQNTGDATPVGHPSGVAKISGLAFEPNGDLYASSISAVACYPPPCMSPGVSDLIRINAANGTLLSDMPITANGRPIQIGDLAVQPGNGRIFGVSAWSANEFAAAGDLYTIDKSGAATLVGSIGDFFAAIAFAPDGTLYATTADLDMMGNVVNQELKTLNTTNAATVTMVPSDLFYSALAVRSTDGVIFGGNGDGFPDPLGSGLFTINAATGQGILVGHPGLNFVGDLAFQPIPEPGASALCALGLFALVMRYRRS